jgi:ribonuclease HI
MVCNKLKWSESGKLRSECLSSTEAEMKSIVNALHSLMTNIEINLEVKWIIINTDSMNAIHLFTKNKAAIKKFKLEDARLAAIVKKYTKMLGGIKAQKIEFRHVKAHTEDLASRSLANKYCDTMAKMEMEKIVGPIKNTSLK